MQIKCLIKVLTGLLVYIGLLFLNLIKLLMLPVNEVCYVSCKYFFDILRVIWFFIEIETLICDIMSIKFKDYFCYLPCTGDSLWVSVRRDQLLIFCCFIIVCNFTYLMCFSTLIMFDNICIMINGAVYIQSLYPKTFKALYKKDN